MLRLVSFFALLAGAALAHAQGDAPAGVQWTRERDATLVSKNVGAERWAITYRLADGRATGNVYRTDGGPTAFIDCERTAVDGTTATFDCYGADACPGAPCDESAYVLIQSGVMLPLEFFFPPGDGPESRTLQDLVGTWRFVIETDDDDTSEVTYRIDGVEIDDGDEVAVGENEDTDNDVVAFSTEDGFVLLDESTFGCSRYEFDFTSRDRLEGTQSLTLFLPLLGDCEDDPISTNPFFAERIGGP